MGKADVLRGDKSHEQQCLQLLMTTILLIDVRATRAEGKGEGKASRKSANRVNKATVRWGRLEENQCWVGI